MISSLAPQMRREDTWQRTIEWRDRTIELRGQEVIPNPVGHREKAGRFGGVPAPPRKPFTLLITRIWYNPGRPRSIASSEYRTRVAHSPAEETFNGTAFLWSAKRRDHARLQAGGLGTTSLGDFPAAPHGVAQLHVLCFEPYRGRSTCRA